MFGSGEGGTFNKFCLSGKVKQLWTTLELFTSISMISIALNEVNSCILFTETIRPRFKFTFS